MDYSILVFFLVQGMVPLGILLLFLTWKRSISIPVRIGFIGLCLLYSVAPLLLGALGLSLVEQWNCIPEMGLSYTCPSKPELTDIVNGLVFMPWFAIASIPLGLLSILGLIIPPILSGIQHFRRTSDSAPTNTLEHSAENGSDASTIGQWYRVQGANALLAGVCAGIARRFGINTLWVRVPFVALLVISPPIAIVLYGVLRVVMPLAPKSENS